MARLFVTRMLETVFRRWWLYAIPVVVALALGVVTVLGAGSSYRSTGVMLVNRQTLLSELSSLNGGNDFGMDTPSEYTARQINTVLDTELFLDNVITTAGLTGAVESGALTRDEVRDAVGASARGDDLVSIQASTNEPELSYRLAQATIDSYKQWEIDSGLADSDSAVIGLKQLVEKQEQLVQQLEDESIDVDAVESARSLLADYRAQLDLAEQAGQNAETNVSARFRVIDEPEPPTSPTSNRKEDLQTLVLFGVLGLLVSSAAIVVGTLLDRSVRYGEEIELRLKVPVLATVPESLTARAPSAL